MAVGFLRWRELAKYAKAKNPNILQEKEKIPLSLAGCRNASEAHPRIVIILLDGPATTQDKTIEFCSDVRTTQIKGNFGMFCIILVNIY